MLRNRLYYRIKPLLPRRLRFSIRRFIALRQRGRVRNVWPILPGSEQPPTGWQGWPGGKQFAVVLTHDVEGQLGLEKCRALMELEMRMGFRSSFNFVPEGEYELSRQLVSELTSNGFEAAVHDLHHDGKLFQNREDFAQKAARINHHLRDWNAVGFRAGFMLRNLEWLHDLDIRYDASTFDTDPFEPQPDGAGTIFPFWVARTLKRSDFPAVSVSTPSDVFWKSPALGGSLEAAGKDVTRVSTLGSVSSSLISQMPVDPYGSGRKHTSRGYVELPYTLPQDSTLFLLFREKTPRIWLYKLDWIAQHGGMALVNVHPDYMSFNNRLHSPTEFPVRLYMEFLEQLKSRYEGRYWHALPREVAAFVRERHRLLQDEQPTPQLITARPVAKMGKRIWIDLENTPHIPFFRPIIQQLENRGHHVVLTARDAYQTCEMATRYGFAYTRIGRHYGKNRLFKVWGVFARGFQLLPFALRERPQLALNHGSRTQTFICNLLGIPTVTIMDYEYGKALPFLRPMYEITPDVVSEDLVPCKQKNGVRKYSGIKEDVYVPDFKPDSSIVEQLALNEHTLVVTVRPPATEAHYHNPESEVLFERFMDRVCTTPGVKAVLLPRNKRQETQIRTKWPQWFAAGQVIIPDGVVDGLNLLWHSDLVVSGGGTMNREAAALGVPVYSIFRGTIGAVDRHLQAEGRLILIENVEDVNNKILVEPRRRMLPTEFKPRAALGEILEHIDTILNIHYPHKVS